ncbi:hypothetical protein CASFOL_041091 [Castilleja foliolosa]|uniref:Exostosin GT47 domain-containing protein n=1 Tax=Castilleja foliolosa TaxID=1961234 RepID=A0ABD3BF51_9LAMI
MPCQCLRITVKWAILVLIVIVAIFATFSHFYAVIPPDKTNNSFDVYVSDEFFQRNYAEMKRELKIYVYPSDGYDNAYAFSFNMISGYEAEDNIYRNLFNSSFVTTNPDQAQLFFIPFSFHTVREKIISNKQVTSLLGTYVEGLIHKYPYWNKTLGTNHVLFTCFAADINATRVIPLMAQNSIRIACTSNYSVGFISHKDIAIPFPVPSIQNATENRTRLAYWMGVCNCNPCKTLVKLWRADLEFDIITKSTLDERVEKYLQSSKLYSSKFCICPVGSENPNYLITMSILNGCVPVILEDHIDLPFSDVLDWHKFSVILKEVDAYRLKEIVEAKASVDYQILYTNLIKVKKHFYSPSDDESTVEYDAFHMTIYELWLRYQNQSKTGVRQ